MMQTLDLAAFSVNGTEWPLRNVLKQASFEGGFPALENGLRRAVTLAYAEAHHLAVEEQAWKAKANELRRERGLYSVAETSEWLSGRGLTTADLFEAAKDQLLVEQVKRLVTESRIEARFLENRLNFDKANVSQLVIGSREQAQELLFQLEEGEPFYKLAQAYSLNGSSKYDGGYVGWVGRAQLSGEEEALVFGAEAGQTVGPFACGEGFRLLHVWEVAQAALTEEVRLQLADWLFEEWLNEAVSRAGVEVRLWSYLREEQLG